MSKPWVGFLAVGLLFLAGVLQLAGGYPKLGIFLMVFSLISLGLRIYLNKQIKNDGHHNNKL